MKLDSSPTAGVALRPAPELTLGVTLAVLGAGLLHAGWNALLKSAPGGDPLLDTATVVAGSGIWALVASPSSGIPDAASWIFIAGVRGHPLGVLHHARPRVPHRRPVVRLPVDARHRAADRRRSSASCSCANGPRRRCALGILLICAGIVGIAFVGRNPHPRAAVLFALANAAIIAIYTLVDGAGARASGGAASYAVWLTFLEALPFLCWIRWQRGRCGR